MEIIRHMTADKGQKKTIRAEENEEWFRTDETGRILENLLPGEEKKLCLKEKNHLICIKRDSCFSDCIGKGGLVDSWGNRWGGWFAYSCRVQIPRRLASECVKRNEEEPEELIRDTFQKDVEKLFKTMASDDKTGLRNDENFRNIIIDKIGDVFREHAEELGLDVLFFTTGEFERREKQNEK